ncbi:hypothetical protein SAMN04490207_2289 [Pseudomonas gessardii]|uniref:HEAT repeat domain-containing protein n=3 Tax=Pseudomonas gessardii TaxID=78544 RepID=A0A7Y1QPC4_9PSED|nr:MULTISPECIES: hypothetical protein [Pseudomonas]MCF4979970.1 hypothetical protein [Pseudomonas gessardii]MCF5085532.1 hypothetical protein [Pseudomonas gessardii]MCF5108338.1 hypothetical protein [Pseudomonas gessardii]MRU53670.1 hypothetical protein [Pseudomonas gessardii]NNA65471.1 hypothetical protein [Pseudomonas gessardii]
MNMHYHDPDMSHEEVVNSLAAGDECKVATALISIGLNEKNGVWAQEICLRHMSHDNQTIASAAIVAIGHIARRFRALDTAKVSTAMQYAVQKHPSLSGVISSAQDDIEMFT